MNQKKNTNGRKKKRINSLNLQDTKQDLAHPQEKNLILKNTSIEVNKSGQKFMKDQQKEISRNITRIISNLLKVIRNIN